MPRTPEVPAELSRGPFTLVEARRAGLTPHQLQSRAWRRLGNGLYVLADLPEDPAAHLAAIARRLPPQAVFSGKTAGWLLGLDVPPCNPIDVTLPPPAQISAAAGLAVHRALLRPGEVVVRRGVKATGVHRTLLDIASRLPLTDAVVFTDMALHAPLTDLHSLEAWIAGQTHRYGIRRLRLVVAHAEPASESPMESQLRMLLVNAGLPRPEAQVKLYDARGGFLGRADLYYRSARLAIEYDGGTHRDRLLADNRRQNQILNAGIAVLRYCADDVFNRPFQVAAQVRAALSNVRFEGYPRAV